MPPVRHDVLGQSGLPFSRDRRRLIRWLGVSLPLSVALSACGKKGELELPPAQPVDDDQSLEDGKQ